MEDLELKILELTKNGYTPKEIAEIIGKKPKYVYRHNVKSILEKRKKEEAIIKANEEFEELVKKYLPLSVSMNDLCTNLGLKGVDGYYRKIQKVIDKYNLSTAHFGNEKKQNYVKLGSDGKFLAMPDEEFFVNGIQRNGISIVRRLVSSGIREYKCENCGISEWDGKPLRLQIHHMNGNHCDNRIENLQILCPNCHTQTDTYGRKGGIKHTNNGFKVTKRIQELIEGKKSSFVEKKIEEIKKEIKPPKEKRFCEVCGNELGKDCEKYCSYECAQKASRRFEVTSEELFNDFRELKSFSAVGRKYGVSDNAIKKRCKKLGVYEDIRQFITSR